MRKGLNRSFLGKTWEQMTNSEKVRHKIFHKALTNSEEYKSGGFHSDYYQAFRMYIPERDESNIEWARNQFR